MVSRREWGARGSVSRDSAAKREGYVHHTVSAGTFSTLKQQIAHMRALENQHIGQGWSTIGYSFVIFPATKWYRRTRIFEGRGWEGVPAAQANHNSGTIAVAVVGNFEVQKPGRRLERRLVHFWKRARKRGITTLRGHRDAPGQSTACPGKNLYAILPRVRRQAGF